MSTMAETPSKASRQADDINLLNMIESRIMEIVQIEDECKRKLPKLYNQRLPRFMRRRAACHDPRRLPKRLRPKSVSDFGGKDRKKLMKYRRRVRFRKHKRILKRHARHEFKDPNKCLMHKWFAKRFKMEKTPRSPMEHVPLHNNTKNQRTLSRQSKYGCCYLSMAHLVPLRLSLTNSNNSSVQQLEQLNQLAYLASGFTFCARSLTKGRYEVGVHLYRPDTSPPEHICLASVTLVDSHLTLWVPREKSEEVKNYLKMTISKDESSVSKIYPRDWTRVRLVGPEARATSIKLAVDKAKHDEAIDDARLRLSPPMGVLIGRYIEEQSANFTYYNTKPISVDIVFKTRSGRMLWHQLIKNKAHLVGGYRDVDRLLVEKCFKPVPDCDDDND